MSEGEERHALHDLAEKSKAQFQAGRKRADQMLAAHSDQPLVDVSIRLYQRDRETAGAVVGSAIAFRLFLFFVPLTLFVVGLTGFISSFVDSQDISTQTGVTGSLSKQIEFALEQPNSTRWVAVSAGLVGMATTGRSLSKVLVAASCLAWRMPVKTKASPRVVGGIVGLIVGVSLVAAIVNRVRAQAGVGAAGVSFLGAFIVYVVLWFIVSLLLPHVTTDLAGLLPGATVMAATLAGMQMVSQLYLPSHLSRASQLYGAIGTTIVTLGWFFIVGRAAIVGMSLNAVIHERFGRVSQFVFSLPLLRIVARHARWVRRLFDLDEDPADETDTGSASQP